MKSEKKSSIAHGVFLIVLAGALGFGGFLAWLYWAMTTSGPNDSLAMVLLFFTPAVISALFGIISALFGIGIFVRSRIG